METIPMIFGPSGMCPGEKRSVVWERTPTADSSKEYGQKSFYREKSFALMGIFWYYPKHMIDYTVSKDAHIAQRVLDFYNTLVAGGMNGQSAVYLANNYMTMITSMQEVEKGDMANDNQRDRPGELGKNL